MLLSVDASNETPNKACAFLRRWAPGGPVQLTAIEPDTRRITTKYFPTEAGRVDFINDWNGRGNLYFTVNDLRTPADKKPSKANIASMVAAHVDIDVPDGLEIERGKAEALARLAAYHVPPSLVVDSGNGLQAYWRLTEPVEVTAENVDCCEDINRALEEALGGDHCHNIDRIMRLPGTINLPNAKKRAKGRVPVSAVLVEDTDLVYSVEDFRASADRKARSKSDGAETLADPVEELPHIERLLDIPEPAGEAHARLRTLIETGDDFEPPPALPKPQRTAIFGRVRHGAGWLR